MSRAPTQTAEEALAACIRQCGRRANAEVTSENRTAVRKWLVAEGIASSYVQTLSLSTLAGVYKDETNGSLQALRSMSRSIADKPADEIEIEELDEIEEPEPEIADKPAEEPVELKPVRTKNNGQTEAQRKLLEAMQAFTAANASADLDEARVISLIQQHAPKPDVPVYRIEVKLPDRPKISDEAKPRHEVFPEVCAAVAAGLNVLLVGPAGCGKTHLGEQVCEAIGIPFRFTGAVSSEYKLLGFVNAHGGLVRTEYREAYEHGGGFLWDEMDASSPGALLAFNAGLANGHQDFPDVVVKRHANFRAMASCNTYGNGADRQYVGRNQLDAASLDRFYVVPMNYDTALEAVLFDSGEIPKREPYKAVPNADVRGWASYVQRTRRAVSDLKIRHVVSMRAIDMGQRALLAGIPRNQVERATLWKHLGADDITKIRAAM